MRDSFSLRVGVNFYVFEPLIFFDSCLNSVRTRKRRLRATRRTLSPACPVPLCRYPFARRVRDRTSAGNTP